VTEEDACAIGTDIDDLWDELTTQMCAATFDANAVKAKIDAVVSQANMDTLLPVIEDALSKADAPLIPCSDPGGFGLYELSGYITQIKTEGSALYTQTICQYVTMIGTTCANAFVVLSGGVNALDETLGLSAAITALGATSSPCTFTAWTSDGCPACVPSVWAILNLGLNGGTVAEWDAALDAAITAGVLSDILADVIDLLKALHDVLDASGRQMLCGLIPTLPELLIGMLSDSIESQCDVTCPAP